LYIARDSESELIDVLRTAWDAGIDVRVLGGGANVLIGDRGFRGLIVVNHLTDFHRDGVRVRVSGGTGLTVLCRKLQPLGLSGFEWAVAVPGTVGGAVVNNAGAHGSDTAANLRTIDLLTPGGVAAIAAAALGYDYRTSALKRYADRRFLVLRADFVFTPDDPAAIQQRMDEFNAHRKRTQPAGASLGSIFKNPPGDYAGRLIEAAGLKGYRIGAAMVSPVHANFFINVEGRSGSAADYRALVRHVQQTVAAQFDVTLETEIEFLGEF
ncbi:MAG TPA: UDP-N-acetylmuramate dehydrogenase, partial [Aggregatilineales bacterium]|nr:UDP-N-acetylmuramate dehydrogenase [Aggregatilineales bacterium]